MAESKKPKTILEAMLEHKPASELRLSDLLSGVAGRQQFTPQPLPILDRWFKDETIYIDGYTFEII